MADHDHGGHRDRMRARFERNGLDGFAPHEALELLLFYAIPRRNTNPLAHQLIDRFGSLEAVCEAPKEQLMQVPGVGEHVQTLLSLMPALARYMERERMGERPVVSNYKEAKAYCKHLFSGKTDEVLYVVCLDAQHRVIRAVPAITGTIDEITIYPRTIVGEAYNHHAHSVVLAHNHPSGVCEPSDADIQTTEQLRAALSVVSISLLDHIIYADGECVSIAQWLQMQRIAPAYHETSPAKAADTKRKRAPGAEKPRTPKDG